MYLKNPTVGSADRPDLLIPSFLYFLFPSIKVLTRRSVISQLPPFTAANDVLLRLVALRCPLLRSVVVRHRWPDASLGFDFRSV